MAARALEHRTLKCPGQPGKGSLPSYSPPKTLRGEGAPSCPPRTQPQSPLGTRGDAWSVHWYHFSRFHIHVLIYSILFLTS